MKKYIPSELESKWQQKWREAELYKVDLADGKDHYYVLVEFSYPSGDLHMGHWYAFAVPDILARFKRMTGHKVFFPNGFDAFGLPAENAAIKRNIHPQDWTLGNIEKMKGQFATMGASFDWSHEVITCLPEYYKWNQWIFLKMLEKGLAYKGQKASNWCPSCQTVLANENVEDGKCWRCGTIVEQKQVNQWFLKITEFADRLEWKENPSVDWPKAVREGQNNWIGKSEGVLLDFKIDNSNSKITVFTTALDTVFGVSFMVISPENTLVDELTTATEKTAVEKYLESAKNKTELERTSLEKDKTGVFTGSYAINPFNGEKVEIWVADYVLISYGTGAVMGVPGHDSRDHAFAKKYKLQIKPVIKHTEDNNLKAEDDGFWDYSEIKVKFGSKSELINSGQFNGLTSIEAKKKMEEYIEREGFGKRTSNYHLHDWSISRQRYWGTPIPIIYCDPAAGGCGTVPVPEKDLPVELPYEVDYAPKGKPPLATAEEWVNVACPECGKPARREVETMDTFIDSSWYFFRYLDPENKEQPFDKLRAHSWMPVDIYFGGAEHTLGHTLYSRFFTKFLFDEGLSPVEEYAKKRVNRGLILGPDGAKMSKSKGNVINPDDQVKDFGADAVRLYLAFIGPYAETVTPWENSGVAGIFHFLQRVWGLQEKLSVISLQLSDQDLRIMHKTIKKVSEDLNQEKFNTVVAFLMEWLNHLSRKEKISAEEYKTLLLLLAPFAPHMTEELYQATGNREQATVKNWSIHQQSFPKYEEKYLEEDEILIVVQVNGKLRDSLMIQKDMLNNSKDIENLAKSTKNTQKYLENTAVKKVIYIPGKLINFVV